MLDELQLKQQIIIARRIIVDFSVISGYLLFSQTSKSLKVVSNAHVIEKGVGLTDRNEMTSQHVKPEEQA